MEIKKYKFTKYLFLTAVFLSMNVAHAQSSSKGYIFLSQENFYNVPIPSWMINDNNSNQKNNFATIIPVNDISSSTIANKNILDTNIVFTEFSWLLKQYYCYNS